MSDIEDVEHGLESALHTAFPNTYITRYYALLEVIQADGERAMYLAPSDGLSAWDAQGMLTYALAREQQLMAIELNEDE